MKRIFDFNTYILERHEQMVLPFPGQENKMHHQHILDAFEDTETMPSDQYKSSADVIKLIDRYQRQLV